MSSEYLAIQLVDAIASIKDILKGKSADADKIKEIKKYINWLSKELGI